MLNNFILCYVINILNNFILLLFRVSVNDCSPIKLVVWILFSTVCEIQWRRIEPRHGHIVLNNDKHN